MLAQGRIHIPLLRTLQLNHRYSSTQNTAGNSSPKPTTKLEAITITTTSPVEPLASRIVDFCRLLTPSLVWLELANEVLLLLVLTFLSLPHPKCNPLPLSHFPVPLTAPHILCISHWLTRRLLLVVSWGLEKEGGSGTILTAAMPVPLSKERGTHSLLFPPPLTNNQHPTSWNITRYNTYKTDLPFWSSSFSSFCNSAAASRTREKPNHVQTPESNKDQQQQNKKASRWLVASDNNNPITSS